MPRKRKSEVRNIDTTRYAPRGHLAPKESTTYKKWLYRDAPLPEKEIRRTLRDHVPPRPDRPVPRAAPYALTDTPERVKTQAKRMNLLPSYDPTPREGMMKSLGPMFG